MHAISSYRGNRATHRQDRLQYTALQLVSAQCNIIMRTTYVITNAEQYAAVTMYNAFRRRSNRFNAVFDKIVENVKPI